MSKAEILKKLKQSFIDEDVKEPFTDKEYVEETLRIFDLLLGGFNSDENETDNAIYDIVTDIFTYFDETDELERLIKKKMKIIKVEGEVN